VKKQTNGSITINEKENGIIIRTVLQGKERKWSTLSTLPV